MAEDNPIYHMISRIYSSDRVTAEYVLADARMQCAIMFIATPDDGSRPSTGSGIDPTLSTIDWIDACTRDKWISDWKKARGEGTMAKDWDEHPNQGKELAAFLLDKRDLIGRLDYRAKDLDHDPLAKVTPFKSDIANAGMACVIALPKDKIPR